VWATDLTQVKDRLNNVHNLFGILDSGTRACLLLTEVKTKASIMLLRCLLDTIEQFGKPAAIRTDNEAVFTSRLFRFCLWVLQIKHQRTQVCSPWQNGRIERFFGTLKRKLAFYDLDKIGFTQDLATYRFWYNHVRTHQYLNGKTPAEVWDAKAPRGKPKEFSVWDGALTGIYFSPP
jgi:transposase InsO family protein